MTIAVLLGIVAIGSYHYYKEYDEQKINLDKCHNDYIKLKNEESDKLLKLTECQTERKARENFKLENLDSKCNERMLNLEKHNVTCYTDRKNVNEKFAKCEEDRVSCQKDRETLRGYYAGLNEEYARCDTRFKAQIENEKKGNALPIYSLLEQCEKDKKNCKNHIKKCEKDKKKNEEKETGWF